MTDLTPINQDSSLVSQEEALEDAATAATTHPPHALTRTAYVLFGLETLRYLETSDMHTPVSVDEFRDMIGAGWFQMTRHELENLLARAVSETDGAVTEVGTFPRGSRYMLGYRV
jgi:hypothetical protein